MNRDTVYRPSPRSVNGIERQPVPPRPLGQAQAPREVPVAEQSPVMSRASTVEPRLIDDFIQQSRSATERVVDATPSPLGELMMAAVAETEADETPELSRAELIPQLSPLVTTTGASFAISAETGSHFEASQQSQQKHVGKVMNTWIRYGLPILATVLIIIGAVMAVVSIMNNLSLKEQVEAYAAGAADSGEVKGESQSNGTMPVSNVTDPRAPKHIDISAIDVSASMTIVGVNNKGNIGSPANIRQASWYKGSDSPLDSQGDAMIVGHVGTDRYAGAFARLHELKEGDTITLTMGDGKQLAYEVTESVDVAPEAMDVGTYIGRGAAHKDSLLHLVTCTGEYNARTHTYDHRLIVTAKRL